MTYQDRWIQDWINMNGSNAPDSPFTYDPTFGPNLAYAAWQNTPMSRQAGINDPNVQIDRDGVPFIPSIGGMRINLVTGQTESDPFAGALGGGPGNPGGGPPAGGPGPGGGPPGGRAPTAAEVAANPNAYAGTSFDPTRQASSLGSNNGGLANNPGESNWYRQASPFPGANAPPQGAINVGGTWVMPYGNTWNAPGQPAQNNGVSLAQMNDPRNIITSRIQEHLNANPGSITQEQANQLLAGANSLTGQLQRGGRGLQGINLATLGQPQTPQQAPQPPQAAGTPAGGAGSPQQGRPQIPGSAWQQLGFNQNAGFNPLLAALGLGGGFPPGAQIAGPHTQLRDQLMGYVGMRGPGGGGPMRNDVGQVGPDGQVFSPWMQQPQGGGPGGQRLPPWMQQEPQGGWQGGGAMMALTRGPDGRMYTDSSLSRLAPGSSQPQGGGPGGMIHNAMMWGRGGDEIPPGFPGYNGQPGPQPLLPPQPRGGAGPVGPGGAGIGGGFNPSTGGFGGSAAPAGRWTYGTPSMQTHDQFAAGGGFGYRSQDYSERESMNGAGQQYTPPTVSGPAAPTPPAAPLGPQNALNPWANLRGRPPARIGYGNNPWG